MDQITSHQRVNTPIKTFFIEQNVSLADKNWFNTGGPAKFYCQPKTHEEFAQALQFAKEQHVEIFMLGHGANILISDDGFDGLVIHPKLNQISMNSMDKQTAQVTAGAGVSCHDLIEFCLDHNLLGLEEFSGIPGTVGGSVYINLHYFEFFLSQFLTNAQVIDKETNEIITVTPEWFNFGYDTSKLHEKKHYLLSATFKVKKATELETSFARGRRLEIIKHRTRRFPTSKTCGSFFRNFLPEEVANSEKKLIYVAYYLDKIGVKGELSVGDAIVSYQHANMIVNRGKATSNDIIELAQLMQKKVIDTFGVKPQAECQLVGFKTNPLQ